MIEIREQNKEENLVHGDAFPITLIIGETRRYLTLKAFEELKSKLNTFAIHDVSDSACPNCDGYGYTLDENGRRKEHCDKC